MRALPGGVVPVVVALLAAPLLTDRGAIDAQAAGPDADGLQRGGAVFQATCAACHGSAGEGRTGTGVGAGPPLTDLPVAYIDLVVRTGRMPIAEPELGVRVDQLGDDDREALVDWMRDRFELPGTIPRPGHGDAGRGLAAFVNHCAACHGAGGAGGVAGGGTFVPAISGRDAVTVVESIRVGPFDMPAFPEEVVDDGTAADIAAYLAAADDPPRTALGLRELNPVGTSVAAAVLVAVTVGLVRVASRRRREEGRT